MKTRATLLALTLLTSIQVPNAMAAPATASFMLKDPYLAGRAAESLFFGAQDAVAYLETMQDGTRRPLSDLKSEETKGYLETVDTIRFHCNMGTYMMLGTWALALGYALFVPDAGKGFWDNSGSSVLRGLVAASGSMTYVNWMNRRVFIGPFFERMTPLINAERAQESAPR
ncbi:MAG TPA: hypothetical protein V6D00_05665 [Pantanalinema sp.]